MEKFKQGWQKGVRETQEGLRALGAKPPAPAPAPPPAPGGAAEISKADLMQLTMKLTAKLKAAESAHGALARRARAAEADRDALKSFASRDVLGAPGALDGVEVAGPAGSEKLRALWGARREALGGAGPAAERRSRPSVPTLLRISRGRRPSVLTLLRISRGRRPHSDAAKTSRNGGRTAERRVARPQEATRTTRRRPPR